MDYIHNKISEKINWYKKWHTMDSPDIVHWLLFILVVVLTWSSINGQIYIWLNQISEQDTVVLIPNTKATLSLDPQTSSVKIVLKPAPKGSKLIVQKELRKILELAGLKDVYSKSFGQTRTGINLVYALEKALINLNEVKLQDHLIKVLGVREGSIKA